MFVGFFEILENFVIKAFGFEISGKIRKKSKKRKTEVLFKDRVPVQINPENIELNLSKEDISKNVLDSLKNIYDIVEEEK